MCCHSIFFLFILKFWGWKEKFIWIVWERFVWYFIILSQIVTILVVVLYYILIKIDFAIVRNVFIACLSASGSEVFFYFSYLWWKIELVFGLKWFIKRVNLLFLLPQMVNLMEMPSHSRSWYLIFFITIDVMISGYQIQ